MPVRSTTGSTIGLQTHGNGVQQSAEHVHRSSNEHVPSPQGGLGGCTLHTLPSHCTQDPVLLLASLWAIASHAACSPGLSEQYERDCTPFGHGFFLH